MTGFRSLSFLGMAGHEFRVPLAAAAASVAVVLAFYDGARGSPRLLFAIPAIVFLAATLWGWARAYGRLRAVGDIPLSPIATAAQGYARLEGRAESFPGHPVHSPGSGRECCWYSYELHERDDNGNWISRQSETSEWSFAMRDDSGDCVVDPVGARVVPVRVETWTSGRFRHTERMILPGEPLLVVGEFSTSSDAILEHDRRRRAGDLIAEWKKDMPALRKRFDLSGDGEFSDREWELVRAAAWREAFHAAPHRAQNLVSRPRDGQPFLISALRGEHLERDLRIWAWVHMVLFVGGAIAVADWVFRR